MWRKAEFENWHQRDLNAVTIAPQATSPLTRPPKRSASLNASASDDDDNIYLFIILVRGALAPK